jgi:L,D-transpeptidase ErfK/SrfK
MLGFSGNILTAKGNKGQVAMKKAKFFQLFAKTIAIVPLLLSAAASALTYDLPGQGDDIIGDVFKVTGNHGESLADIGARYHVGAYQMLEANPQVSGQTIETGSEEITVPRANILPQTRRRGIVINLSELRLYYYPPNNEQVMTFPIGIGREGWLTPLGVAQVVRKVENPVWHVPSSIKAWAHKQEGIHLPDFILPGPSNPLGKFAMYLSFPGVLIHGTNAPDSIGWRTSSGCIRMMPEDIAYLFGLVSTRTAVTVIDQPFKAGFDHGKLYLEAHLPIQENPAREDNSYYFVTQAVKQAIGKQKVAVDWNKVHQVADSADGIPTEVGSLVQ